MARFEFKLPDIGEGVTEGEIVGWGDGVEVGSRVEVDQTLAEVMTDKATVTIPSPKAGKVAELGGNVGDVIAVGAVLLVLDTDEAGDQPAEPAPGAQAPPPAPEPAPSPARAPGPPPAPSAPSKAQEQDASSGESSGPSATAAGAIPEALPGMAASAPSRQRTAGDRPLAAPATRKLARELGVALDDVAGSGPHGRITQDDVRRHADQGAGGAASASSAVVRASAAQEPMRIAPARSVDQEREERIPLRGVRKKIFEQMARSKHTAAHFTFVEECDVTALKALRARLRPLAEEQGAKLSFLPFIVKACVAALERHPILNAAYDEATEEIVLRRYYDIGVAAATDAGLMVPVVKQADDKSILDISVDIQRLAEGARDGKLQREDLVGSTFTITSLGSAGGLFATPILNFPEVAILGVHQVKQKPVVRDGEIVIGDVMLLSLSFDHRIIDGHVGAAFAYEVIGYLENPDKLMLEMA